MWGTSSPDDKLTGDLGSVIETTQIGGRRSDRLMAGKLSRGNFGLLQQYHHAYSSLDHLVGADEWGCHGSCRRRRKSGDRLAVAPHWWTISKSALLISTPPDDAVTFTCRLFETASINDLKIATAVADEPCCLKHSGDHCNSRSSHPEHL